MEAGAQLRARAAGQRGAGDRGSVILHGTYTLRHPKNLRSGPQEFSLLPSPHVPNPRGQLNHPINTQAEA